MKKFIEEKLAMAVRVLSIPPIMVTALVIALSTLRSDVFTRGTEIWMTLLFLALLPAAAYPISYFIPRLRQGGRELQRNLAFALSAVGYTAALLYGVFLSHNAELIAIYAIYLLSVVFLLVFNKLLHLRASGHGSSVTGPIVLSCSYFGWGGILLGVVLYALIFWASLKTRRHTAREFILGSATSLAAFLLVCIIHPLGMG